MGENRPYFQCLHHFPSTPFEKTHNTLTIVISDRELLFVYMHRNKFGDSIWCCLCKIYSKREQSDLTQWFWVYERWKTLAHYYYYCDIFVCTCAMCKIEIKPPHEWFEFSQTHTHNSHSLVTLSLFFDDPQTSISSRSIRAYKNVHKFTRFIQHSRYPSFQTINPYFCVFFFHFAGTN